MKKRFTLLFLFLCFLSNAQDFHAWIYFADKPAVAAALANPQSILTPKAIARKARHQVTIDYRDVPVNQSYVATIKSQAGIDYISQSKWFNCVLVKGTPANIDALINQSFVTSIDYADPSKSATISDFSKESLDVTTPLNYGDAFNQINQMGLVGLHNAGFAGSGMTIAVTDSGFPAVDVNPGFNQLRLNNGILGGYDFVAGDGAFYDDNYHGAWVLSAMAGNVPSRFEGAAPDAQYYLFRTEDATKETPAELGYWVAAAERADSLGVDLINVSLGYLDFDNTSENLNYADMDGQTSFISRGANIALEKGLAVITSAGNSGRSASNPFIASPADAPGVFSIGSVTATGVKSNFSSIGPTADGRLKPDIVAQGSSTYLINELGNIITANGTSFSSPLATGGMACFMQAFPNLKPQEVFDIIRNSASLALNPDNFLGHGIPNFFRAYEALTLSTISNKVPTTSYYVKENQLFIDFAYEQTSSMMHLYNLQGQLILKKVVTSREPVLLDTVSSGLYIFTLEGVAGSFKIIK